jgi:4-hydroxythreonine-4-phosphate dehydrogenase
VAQVARHITAQAVFEKAVVLDEFLRRSGLGHNPAAVRVSPAAGETLTSQSGTVPDFPHIGVLALNPHGEEFSLGEERRIAAGVALARKAGINAVGPIPADAAVAGAGIHHRDTKTQRGLGVQAGLSPFEGFVAMYHDQGMIPAKLLGRDAGVNVTLGLGRIRTSPLHGVAFDIAGRGIASAGSMIAAIRLARKLASAC